MSVEFTCMCGQVATVAAGRVKTCRRCGVGLGLSDDGENIQVRQCVAPLGVMSVTLVDCGNRYVATGMAMEVCP